MVSMVRCCGCGHRFHAHLFGAIPNLTERVLIARFPENDFIRGFPWSWQVCLSVSFVAIEPQPIRRSSQKRS
jgi:hypothetical protein